MRMTAEQFEELLGYKPENDDLERANCKNRCIQCGICKDCGLPRFVYIWKEDGNPVCRHKGERV